MKITNSKVLNFEGAIRGARNPLSSWEKSDSYYNYYDEREPGPYSDIEPYVIGENDLKLCQKLIAADGHGAGEPNSKFLRQIFVTADIEAPIYFWKELDTYKVATTANSTSTMHTLAKTPITTDMFEMGDFQNINLGGNETTPWVPQMSTYAVWDDLVGILELLRQKYIETGNKAYWKELIRLLPESWLQRRTWTADYVTLRNIWYWRRGHRLSEWQYMIDWIESLPYSKELIQFNSEE